MAVFLNNRKYKGRNYRNSSSNFTAFWGTTSMSVARRILLSIYSISRHWFCSDVEIAVLRRLLDAQGEDVLESSKSLSWQRFPDEGLHEGAPRGKPAATEEHSRVERSQRPLARSPNRSGRDCWRKDRRCRARWPRLSPKGGGENRRGRREEGTKEAVTRREETEKPRAFRFVSDIHVGLGGGAVVL